MISKAVHLQVGQYLQTTLWMTCYSNCPDASGLKSIEGWTDEGNGTNASTSQGLATEACDINKIPTQMANMVLQAVMGIRRDSSIGSQWASEAFDWYMSQGDTSVIGRQAYPKNFGFSVRCIVTLNETGADSLEVAGYAIRCIRDSD